MSSNLRVDRILPSTGTEVGVGTATGSVALYGDVNVAGTLTYEDVTSVDSVGLSTFQNGIHVTGGTVGIGTDNPGAKTHIDSTTSNTPLVVEASQNNRSRIVFRNNVETGTECNIELFDDDLRFVTNSGERLRITSDGDVGINRPIPSAALDVESATDQTVLRLRNNGGNNTRLLFSNKSAGVAEIFYQGDFRFVDDENSDAERIRITSSGDVNIGGADMTQTIYAFQVSRDLGTPSASGTTLTRFRNANSTYSQDLYLKFNNSKDIIWEGGSGNGGMTWDMGTRGYVWQIGGSEKVRISSGGLAVNKSSAADTDIEIVQSADPTLRLHDTRNAAYKADFMMAGSAPLIRNNNTTASNRTFTVQKGTTDHLVIEGNGAVRKPLSPSFSANLSSGNLNAATHNNVIIFNNEHFDNGNNYDPSNGRFTASVAGKYYFGVQIYGGFALTGVRVLHAKFQKNGSDVASGDMFGGASNHGGTSYHPTGCASMMIDLAVNDYVTFSSGSFSGTGSGHATIYAASGTRFFGYLVG